MRKVPSTIIYAALCSLLLLSSCTSNLKRNDVIGTYSTTVPYGVGTLTLAADGSYSQVFTYKSGRSVNNKGQWQYAQDSSNSITLENALVIGHNLGPPDYGLGRSDWALSIDCFAGRTFMEYNPDEGWVFKKMN